MNVAALRWALNALLLLEDVHEEVIVHLELMTDEDAVVLHCVGKKVVIEGLEESAYCNWYEGRIEAPGVGECAG